MSSHSSLSSIIAPVQCDLDTVRRSLVRRFPANITLLQQARRSLRQKGKGTRAALVLLFGKLLDGKRTIYLPLAEVVEIVHLASLIHDDVIDNASIRRGVKSANAIVGNRRAVSIGDFLLALSLEIVLSFQSMPILSLFAQTIREMCEGEMLELASSPPFSFRHYEEIVEKKTASLFGASTAFGSLSAGVEEWQPYYRFGFLLGKAFQAVDDVLDYTGEEKQLGKSVYQDIKEGKITLPLLCALQGETKKKKEELLAQLSPPLSQDRAVSLARFVHEKKGAEKAQKRAESYITEARQILTTFSPSVYQRSLDALALFILQRKQ